MPLFRKGGGRWKNKNVSLCSLYDPWKASLEGDGEEETKLIN